MPSKAEIRAFVPQRRSYVINSREVEYMTELPFHFESGMFIRNNWSIWQKDSPLKRDFIDKYRIAHGDDISALLFGWTFAIVRGQDFDPVAFCKPFHDHWQTEGLTALQAGE